MNVSDLQALSPRELMVLLRAGHPIDPGTLEGWAFRGTVLATPRLVQRLTWQTFQKTFHRLPDGRLVGWNVRLEQDGLEAPSRPKLDDGVPRCVWPYEVLPPTGEPGFDRGLVIDYAPFARGLDSMRFVKDPLVAVEASGELLLGVSYAVVGRARVVTPTWFALRRDHPLSYVPPFFAPAPLLRDFERRWARLLFEALLGGPLPEHERFWQLLSAHAPALVGPGLRVAVHTLSLLPVTMRGFGRPFFALDAPSRLACIEAMAEHPSLPVKQLLSTLKVLACFALLEAEGVRGRLAGQGLGDVAVRPPDAIVGLVGSSSATGRVEASRQPHDASAVGGPSRGPAAIPATDSLAPGAASVADAIVGLNARTPVPASAQSSSPVTSPVRARRSAGTTPAHPPPGGTP